SIVDGLAEFVDLRARSHLNSEGDCAIAMPVTVFVAPGIEIQEPGGTLITPHHLRDVTQIDRSSGSRCSDCDVREFVLALELAGGVNRNGFAPDAQLTSRQRDVSRAENVVQLTGLKTIRGEPRLRIEQVNAFIQHT